MTRVAHLISLSLLLFLFLFFFFFFLPLFIFLLLHLDGYLTFAEIFMIGVGIFFEKI